MVEAKGAVEAVASDGAFIVQRGDAVEVFGPGGASLGRAARAKGPRSS
jgi:hypothetical protein